MSRLGRFAVCLSVAALVAACADPSPEARVGALQLALGSDAGPGIVPEEVSDAGASASVGDAAFSDEADAETNDAAPQSDADAGAGDLALTSDAGFADDGGGILPSDAGVELDGGVPSFDAAPPVDAAPPIELDAAPEPPADTDGDGVVDTADNCPTTPNANQANQDGDARGDACDGDVDGDGIANASDNCATTPNANQANLDGDAFGDACDADRDGDGRSNTGDDCPDVRNSDQADQDGDAIGDVCDSDVDGDGMANTNDRCPSVADPAQTDADGDGIGDACDPDFGEVEPEPAPEPVPEPEPVDPCAIAPQTDLDGDGSVDACDADADGDSMSNEEELAAGSDVLNARSVGKVFAAEGGVLPLWSSQRLTLSANSMAPLGPVVAEAAIRDVAGVTADVIEFSPESVRFEPPARLTASFDASLFDGLIVAIADVGEDGAPRALDGCTVALEAVTCDVTRLSTFAVIGLLPPSPASDAGAPSEPSVNGDAGAEPPPPQSVVDAGADPVDTEPEAVPSDAGRPAPRPTRPRPSRPGNDDDREDRDNQPEPSSGPASPWTLDQPWPVDTSEIPTSWEDLIPGDGGSVVTMRVKARCACEAVGATGPSGNWAGLLLGSLLLGLWSWRRRV